MIAAPGVFLLGGLIYHAVIGIVSYFPNRPFSFGRPFQVVAPGLTANCGACRHTLFSVSLGLVACLYPFALCAHVLALAFASRFVGTETEQAYASHYGKQEENFSSVGIHHEDGAHVGFRSLRVFSEKSIG